MEECVFCKITNGEIPTNFVYQDENLVAFRDIKPVAPVHILIAPRKHIPSLVQVSEEDKELLGKLLLVANQIAKKEGIDGSGYRIGINVGKGAGQIVFHLHIHLIGGWKAGEKILVP